MSNEAHAKRRGRPAGSNSFVKLRLSDLIRIVGEGAVVPVSKVWLRENGIQSGDTVPTPILVRAATPKEEEQKISFSISTFED